jgi:serine/threonine protein kinase
MIQPPKKIDSRSVYLDPFLLDRHRINMGLARKALATKAKLAINTVLDAFNGGGLQPFNARRIAETLGCEVTELLAPWDSLYKLPTQPPGPWSGSSEWEPTGYLDQGRLASNGLYYVVCRMRHRHTANRQGRGKFYHLSWLPTEKRKGMLHQFSRHADVCARVGIHPHIAVNHTSTPVVNDDGWWVIDDWVGETNLASHLKSTPWPKEALPKLLLDIASGLDVLHKADIVFRELAPSRILISEKDGHGVLTDFELAKLLDGGQSVSDEWPEDPFRAPEVDGGTTTIQADLYSLAQVAAACVAGPDYAPDHTVELLKTAGMPKRLNKLMDACSEPVPKKRPGDFSLVIKELARWAEQ